MSELPSVPGYRLLSLLGEGGMGLVYLAEDVLLGRRTAIKFVSERMSADPDARSRFLREARTMASVEHAHVVRVYSFGESGGRAYLVMEYVAGQSLAERLRLSRKLDATEAVRITRQVAEALDAAWEHQLVHRDIKPSNILIDTKGQVHVADFGLAKPLGVATADAGLTQAGFVMGTPHYVSPEQARGRPVDIRSDIYSLGIMLFEMLAGERPFDGKTPFDIVAQHVQAPLPSLETRRPGLPADVIALVSWMTEKDPERRPQTYAALRERLRTLGEAGATTPIPPSTLHGVSAKGSGPRARWAGLSVLLLLTAGIAAWMYTNRATPPPPPDERLVVAVTPFSGPDEDSAKEGKVMAALIERAINVRLRSDDVRVIGVDRTREPVRSHEAARALGERLGANAVIWGEAFALRGESEIQPYLTLVPRHTTEKEAGPNLALLGLDPLAALAERSVSSLVMGAQAQDQIELRKTGAAGISDLVLVLAGSHALSGGHAEKALALFTQAPRTAENLRRRADSLLMLSRAEEARATLVEAAALAPTDARSQASLGDVLLKTGRFPEAVAAYTRAGAAGGPYHSREAILHDGRLYQRETYRTVVGKQIQTEDTLYMIGLDPRTGRVLERHPLPGPITGLSPSGSGISVSYLEDEARQFGEPFEARVEFAHGAFARRLFPSTSLLRRRRLATSGREMGRNFEPDAEGETEFRPRGTRAHVPRDFTSLDDALGRARSIDPTQPWYLFLQGQSAWAQGRRSEGESTWKELFAAAYPGFPYENYAYMAADFERHGQITWAARAYAEALKRRRLQGISSEDITMIERLVLFPFLREGVRSLRLGGDPERGHAWLQRVREIGGLTEADELAAAVWSEYFKKHGDPARAESERKIWQDLSSTPSSSGYLAARLDYAITLFVALSMAAWAALSTLIAAGRGRARARGADAAGPREALSQISGPERRVATTAFILAVVAYGPVAFQANRIVAGGASTPVGIADSLGSPAGVRWADRLVDASGHGPAAVFVAAVAHQISGDGAGARKLYELLPDDKRATANLAALAENRPMPPSVVTLGDASEALISAMTLSDLLSLRGLVPLLDFDPVTPILWITLALGLVFAIAQSLNPISAARASVEPSSAWRNLVPGIVDLRGGSPLRGQVALSLASVSITALSFAAYAMSSSPAFGLISRHGPTLQTFPLPEHSFWTVFFAQRGAVAYWSCVGVATLGAILMQVLAVRRARGRNQAGSPAEPTLSSQDTRLRA